MPRLASLETDGWELECGETVHLEAPDTFALPAQAERDDLQPGQLVKLMFRISLRDDNGNPSSPVERMWVKVTGRVDRLYRGELDNDPHCTDEIQSGMEVHFEARHVIQIWRDDA
jgi:hypothetical protein